MHYALNLHHLLLGVLEALGDVVDRLVLGDGVFLQGSLGWLKGSLLRLIREAVLQLPEGRQQPGAVSLQFTVLATHSELHSEPIAL